MDGDSNRYPVTDTSDWCGEFSIKIQRLKDVPIDHADYLSVRTLNRLEDWSQRKYPIDTLWDLSQLTETELLLFRGIGKTCLREIKKSLSEYGAELRKT